MRGYGHALTVFAACMAAAVFSGGARAVAPISLVRPLYFEHLTTRDGLSQSSVMSILQDSRGYLWLATESGLDRYDGYSIREYHRERGSVRGLASDYIWKIVEDTRGDLWLATSGGGVAHWNRATDHFQQFRHDPKQPRSLASDAVRTLLIDARGRVWAGTEDQGLDVLDPQSGLVRHFQHREGDPRSLPSNAVSVLYADRCGRIWVGSDGGLSRYDPTTDAFTNYGGSDSDAPFSSLRVRAIREDHTGVFWIGTQGGGLNRLVPETSRVTVFRHDRMDPRSLSHDWVWDILEDDGQRLWVATADGLNLLDPALGTFVRYGNDADNPQSLRDSYVMSLYQDRGGVLWVGTRRAGASHWNPRSWFLGHYRSASFRNTAVSSFAEGGSGKVWVGTVGSGLIEVDTRSGRERTYGTNGELDKQLTDSRVMALLHDGNAALWVGTMAGGLDRLDLTTGKVNVYRRRTDDPRTLPADGVMCLYEDRVGKLWIGTFGGGLASMDRTTGTVTRYPYGSESPQALSGARASAIAEDARGNLWIGTAGGGLNLLDRQTGLFHHYHRDEHDPNSLSDDTIYAVHVDASGDVWVGTAGGGLDRVIGSSAAPDSIRFESESGLVPLPSQVVWGIESDTRGRLWISTDNGLARFNPRDRSLRLFHEAQGLQGEEFSFNAHYRSPDGTLFFGGNNGFNVFSPDANEPYVPPPRVVLTAAAKLNHSLAPQDLPGPGRSLTLSYEEKLLTFEFAALDFTSPADNRYAWRLEGFDSGWVDAGRLHRATYTNLEAGDYVFKVRAANADGAWSRDELAIPVHVEPAPWNSAAARVVYAMAALLVVGYFWRSQWLRRERELRHKRELEHTVRVRTHELEDRNRQLQVLSRAKSDFVARMSHELRTPMNGVLGMTALMLDTPLDPTQKRFAEAIHRSADSLLGIVDDVLDFSKIEAGRLQLDPVDCDLVELVEHTVEMLAARAAAKGIELLCDSPSQPIPRVRVDAVRLRQVLVNLGGNAVKFTDQGAVTVRVLFLKSAQGAIRLRLEVSDTGVGIAPENQARIFEEFAQEDASTTRRFGGTGLGLSIARQIVELMGGELTLVSAPGVVSTFSVEVSAPLADPSAQPPALLPDLEGLRALVVCSHGSTRALVSRALRDWGARPTEVASLAAALAELRATSYQTLIVEDPLSDGLAADLLEQLRALQIARPRSIRLLSFVGRSPAPGASPVFDAELNKPLRLKQLHAVLAGRVNESESGFGIADMHAKPSQERLATLRGRVLVVEDQPLNREVANGLLTSLGLTVQTATHGQEALELLRSERIDLVLMDCEMPVMDGFSATESWRRSEPEGSHLPIVALTADATSAGRNACLSAGMDDYLAKPFTREALHTVLSRWLPQTPKLPQPAEAAGPMQAARIRECLQPVKPPAAEALLDRNTLNALRAASPHGPKNLLSRVAERYLSDSQPLVASIERAIEAGNAAELARAAHAWRSYNGNLGAQALARLCRDLEDRGRRGDLTGTAELLAQIHVLHDRVREELQVEIRRSA